MHARNRMSAREREEKSMKKINKKSGGGMRWRMHAFVWRLALARNVVIPRLLSVVAAAVRGTTVNTESKNGNGIQGREPLHIQKSKLAPGTAAAQEDATRGCTKAKELPVPMHPSLFDCSSVSVSVSASIPRLRRRVPW